MARSIDIMGLTVTDTWLSLNVLCGVLLRSFIFTRMRESSKIFFKKQVAAHIQSFHEYKAGTDVIDVSNTFPQHHRLFHHASPPIVFMNAVCSCCPEKRRAPSVHNSYQSHPWQRCTRIYVDVTLTFRNHLTRRFRRTLCSTCGFVWISDSVPWKEKENVQLPTIQRFSHTWRDWM